MQVTFGQLPVGEAFTFRGEVYRKAAMSMATDVKGIGNVFLGETVVSVEGGPAALLPWEPDKVAWFERVGPAPGEGRSRGDS